MEHGGALVSQEGAEREYCCSIRQVHITEEEGGIHIKGDFCRWRYKV